MEKRHLGFVLSYHLPKYIRSTTFRAALEENPSVVLDDAVNTSPKLKRYVETFGKIKKILLKRQTRLWLVHFRGHEIYWPVRWLVLLLPVILMGFYSRVLARNGALRTQAEALEMELGGSFILDGEAFPAGRYILDKGPGLTFVVP